MKIWGDIPGITGVYGKNKSVNKIVETTEIKPKKDVISISDKAKDYQLAMKHLKDIPDIRKDKVEEIAKKLHSGNYDINGNEVADKIIKSIFDTKI
ncbi:MAG TPA: flagellar biosynthesis anti-sigma factor FlgM [Clostridiaceae bacterium]|jgi:negative regulator of flagellin synthesis FlgM|nr:flagellar biosynthesis anti-sigma factor FlgM [Clostridiaceae bacterium]